VTSGRRPSPGCSSLPSDRHLGLHVLYSRPLYCENREPQSRGLGSCAAHPKTTGWRGPISTFCRLFVLARGCAMANIVVAGSNNDNRFAVVDFTVPQSPVNVLATAPFQGGCMVDCTGSLVAVGNYNGGEVAIFDISNPASPTQKGKVNTLLGGIGALSF